MKLLWSSFVILVILPFLVAAPSKPEKTGVKVSAATSKPEGSSKQQVVEDASLQHQGTSGHHGLNLNELLLLKEIMEEDLKDLPWVRPVPREETLSGGRSLAIRNEEETPSNDKEGKNQVSTCSYMVCLDDYQPVCGSNKITYSNDCKLLQQTCAESKLTKLYDGECQTQDENVLDYDANEFDPVFGKLRDFLDELSVSDLKRAIAKLRKAAELNQDKDHTEIKPVDVEENEEQKSIGPCEQKLVDIQKELDLAIAGGNPSVLGSNRPYCDKDGFYMLKQCAGSVCYCVNRLGKQTRGQAPLWKAEELVCGQEVLGSVDDAMEELRNILEEEEKAHIPRG